MSEPMVCCICLTKDRPEMLARAVRSFQAQTYENKRLYVMDSGTPAIDALPDLYPDKGIIYHHTQNVEQGIGERSIGDLRNSANMWAIVDGANIIAHWDDDDWSYPQRLTEQVALLQASGADCVGYSDMLFWDTRCNCKCRPDPSKGESWAVAIHGAACPTRLGEAWLYLGPQKALGTSLCYWRSTWDRKPFPDQPRPGFTTGEDVDWIRGLKLATTKSCEAGTQPRLIAAIHGRNTSGCYKLMAGSDSWRRVPEWDSHCRERMAL